MIARYINFHFIIIIIIIIIIIVVVVVVIVSIRLAVDYALPTPAITMYQDQVLENSIMCRWIRLCRTQSQSF